jgi:hypothetical protein
LLALIALLACSNHVIDDYNTEKLGILADPGPLAPGWEADLRFSVALGTVAPLAQAAAQAALNTSKAPLRVTGPLGLEASLTPTVELQGLRLEASPRCGTCFAATAAVAGTAGWTAAHLSGEEPLSGQLGATLKFELVEQGPSTWALRGTLLSIDSLAVRLDRVGGVDAGPLVERWGQTALGKLQPLELGSFGAAGVPLRGLRLADGAGALLVEGRIGPGQGPGLPTAMTPPRSGWQSEIATESLLVQARRLAFQKGALSHDVAADPRALAIEGDRFSLGLRLWRLQENGWWRDYTVDGVLNVEGDKLSLLAEHAEEGDKSKGAGLADPLALVAEGQILAAVSDSVKGSFPTSTTTRVGGQKAALGVRSVEGINGVVLIRGTLELEAPAGGRLKLR